MRTSLPFSALLAGLAAIPLLLGSCATKHATPAVTAAPTAPAKPEKPKLKASERGEIDSISIEETFQLQQSGGALIFDARPSYFYNQGHIAGAMNMPKSISDDVIRSREAKLKAAKTAKTPIIIYCTNPLCSDARTVARHLSGFGYSSRVFHGGWDAWHAAGLPTESSP